MEKELHGGYMEKVSTLCKTTYNVLRIPYKSLYTPCKPPVYLMCTPCIPLYTPVYPCIPLYTNLLHVTREFHSVKLICRTLYAIFSHVKKAYTASQNGVQLFSHVDV